jgi:hypothetical protein
MCVIGNPLSLLPFKKKVVTRMNCQGQRKILLLKITWSIKCRATEPLKFAYVKCKWLKSRMILGYIPPKYKNVILSCIIYFTSKSYSQDPNFYGPPGSGSGISCTDPDLSNNKKKELRKSLISMFLGLLNNLLSLKTNVNVPKGSNKQNKFFYCRLKSRIRNTGFIIYLDNYLTSG